MTARANPVWGEPIAFRACWAELPSSGPFRAWTDDTTWNGWLNVIVYPEDAQPIRNMLRAGIAEAYRGGGVQGTAERRALYRELRDRTYTDGALDLGYAYCTTEWTCEGYNIGGEWVDCARVIPHGHGIEADR